MKLENIKTEEDILSYIDGSLNDLQSGISDVDEVRTNLVELIVWLVQKDRTNQINKLEKIINAPYYKGIIQEQK